MYWILCCYAGMTTSILAQKLEDSAAERGIELTVQAIPVADVEEHINDADVVLLSPHVRFVADNVRSYAGQDKPIYLIAPQDFGTMNTKAILDGALAML